MKIAALTSRFAAAESDARIIATAHGRDISFADFKREVAYHAARLRAIGCRRGLLTTTDGYRLAVGLFALLHAKAVAVLPGNPVAAEPAAFDTDVVLSDAFLQFESRSRPALEPLDPAAAQIEIFTSGSTGEPKAVMKTLLQMEREAAAIERALGAAISAAPVFGTVPHHHLYGLTFRLFWPLCTGRRMMMQSHAFWESLAAELVPNAILVTSPAHLMRIPDLPVLGAARLGMVLSAGAALPFVSASNAATALACPVTDIFGSTETGVIAHRTLDAASAAWRPFPGVAVQRLADGRLAVRSGHLDARDWHETADLIALAGDGSFELLGRADDVVKVEGNRVSLPEVTAKLVASPLVDQAAVVALETNPASLGAAVVLTAAGEAELHRTGAFRLGRALRRELGETLASGCLPRHWRFVPSLPGAALGKRRNADLTALFARQPDGPLEPELRSERRSDEKVTLELFISPELQCLRGHFPGLPVVPGVAQLDWAVKFAARVFDLPLASADRFQIKFKQVTTAPSDVTLTLRHLQPQRKVAFEYTQGDAVVSQGSFAVHDQR